MDLNFRTTDLSALGHSVCLMEVSPTQAPQKKEVAQSDSGAAYKVANFISDDVTTAQFGPELSAPSFQVTPEMQDQIASFLATGSSTDPAPFKMPVLDANIATLTMLLQLMLVQQQAQLTMKSASIVLFLAANDAQAWQSVRQGELGVIYALGAGAASIGVAGGGALVHCKGTNDKYIAQGNSDGWKQQSQIDKDLTKNFHDAQTLKVTELNNFKAANPTFVEHPLRSTGTSPNPVDSLSRTARPVDPQVPLADPAPVTVTTPPSATTATTTSTKTAATTAQSGVSAVEKDDLTAPTSVDLEARAKKNSLKKAGGQSGSGDTPAQPARAEDLDVRNRYNALKAKHDANIKKAGAALATHRNRSADSEWVRLDNADGTKSWHKASGNPDHAVHKYGKKYDPLNGNPESAIKDLFAAEKKGMWGSFLQHGVANPLHGVVSAYGQSMQKDSEATATKYSGAAHVFSSLSETQNASASQDVSLRDALMRVMSDYISQRLATLGSMTGNIRA